MSTADVWFDDTEIDWSPPRTASRERVPRPPRHRRRGLFALLLVAAAAAAAAAGFAAPGGGGGAPTASAPAPALFAISDAAATPSASAPVTLEAIAQCESRGDPTAVSPDGRYRGKYQFDLATWRAAGGAGDPALAPEAEQDRRARALAAERGTQPWPVCGPAARAG